MYRFASVLCVFLFVVGCDSEPVPNEVYTVVVEETVSREAVESALVWLESRGVDCLEVSWVGEVSEFERNDRAPLESLIYVFEEPTLDTSVRIGQAVYYNNRGGWVGLKGSGLDSPFTVTHELLHILLDGAGLELDEDGHDTSGPLGLTSSVAWSPPQATLDALYRVCKGRPSASRWEQ